METWLRCKPRYSKVHLSFTSVVDSCHDLWFPGRKPSIAIAITTQSSDLNNTNEGIFNDWNVDAQDLIPSDSVRGVAQGRCSTPRSLSTPPKTREQLANGDSNSEFAELYKARSDTQIHYHNSECNIGQGPDQETSMNNSSSSSWEMPETDASDDETIDDSLIDCESHGNMCSTLSFLTMDYLASQILQHWADRNHLYRCHTSDHQSHQTAHVQNALPAKQNVRSRARKTNERSDDEDSDDRHNKKRRSRSPTPKAAPGEKSVPLLACPFNKYHAQRYSERNNREMEYRGCSSCYITSIPRLKQHLYRVHRKPELYCRNCYIKFSDRVTLDDHVRQHPRCQVSVPKWTEKMSEEQLLAIRQRNPGRTDEEKWFSIYAILFPNTIPPQSCYVDQALEDHVQDFLDFLRRDARPILEDGLISAGVVEDGPSLQSAVYQVVEHTISRFMTQVNEGRAAEASVEEHFTDQMQLDSTFPTTLTEPLPEINDTPWVLNLGSDMQSQVAMTHPFVTQAPSLSASSLQFLNQMPIDQISPEQHVTAATNMADHMLSISNDSPPRIQLAMRTQSPRREQSESESSVFDYFNLDADSQMLRSLKSEVMHESMQSWPTIPQALADFRLGLDIPTMSIELDQMSEDAASQHRMAERAARASRQILIRE